MTTVTRRIRPSMRTEILLVLLCAAICPLSASAQVLLSPGQLDQLVSQVALSPDPLVAQVLTASTHLAPMADAAQWADQHSYLTGGNLAGAITQENLPWDPAFYFLPIYDPLIVFGRPMIGLGVGISFGPRIAIGAAFATRDWGRSGFAWSSSTLLLDSHPYIMPRPQANPRVERHEPRPTPRNPKEGRDERER